MRDGGERLEVVDVSARVRDRLCVDGFGARGDACRPLFGRGIRDDVLDGEALSFQRSRKHFPSALVEVGGCENVVASRSEGKEGYGDGGLTATDNNPVDAPFETRETTARNDVCGVVVA